MKAKALEKVLKKDKPAKKEKIYFIDDRVEQIGDVKKKFPQAITIFVKRNEGRYNDKRNKYCDFQIKNLNEALKIIK
jgi:hypothetical protein